MDIGTALPRLEWGNTLNESDPNTADGCVSSLKCVQGFSLRHRDTAAGGACDCAVHSETGSASANPGSPHSG